MIIAIPRGTERIMSHILLRKSLPVTMLFASRTLIPHSGFNSPTFYVEKIDKVVLDTPMLCVGEYVIFVVLSTFQDFFLYL